MPTETLVWDYKMAIGTYNERISRIRNADTLHLLDSLNNGPLIEGVQRKNQSGGKYAREIGIERVGNNVENNDL